MAGNPFTEHPKEIGETYFQHMGVAARTGFKLAGATLACFVHAIFPFWFVTTGSRTIEKLHRQIHKRVDAPNWERHPII
jgi:hypothetical protein